MSIPRIDVNFADDAPKVDFDLETASQVAVREATDHLELNLHGDAELSILICGDTTIRELNNQWRQQDKPTNVLSFPNEPENILLGDIIISMETTAREAGLENKALKDHFCHLMIHGFLHIFGYDHENDTEAAEMECLETEILKGLGIADPYLENNDQKR